MATPASLTSSGVTVRKNKTPILVPRTEAAASLFKKRLRKLGFDKAQSELLAGITPRDKDLQEFFKQVETTGNLLARWNLHPNRIADALREYSELVWRPGAAAPGAEKEAFDRIQFGVVSSLNNAYHNLREAETRALAELYRAAVDASDAYLLLRRFVESMADFFGASAGHLFLLAADRNSWELRASTAVAVSPQAKAAVPIIGAAKRKLRRPLEISVGRTRSPLLLDSGWNRQWRHCWSIPMFIRGEFSGVLQLAFPNRHQMLPRDIELLSIASEPSLGAAERCQLIEDVAGREQSMFALARRMLQVEEIERRRISRELHDDAAQSLAVIRLQMEMIEQSMPPDAAEWRERLAEARDITETTILHMRRLIADLSPAVLEQLGLAAGLRQLVSRFRRTYPCSVRVQLGKLPQLASDFQIVVYRLAQECLKNIWQHSEAKHVNISVTMVDRVLRLRVEDDGVGFHVEEGLGRKHCFGLIGMRERVALLGGGCQIRSTPISANVAPQIKKPGTEIDIRLPIPANFPGVTATHDVVR